MVSSFGRALPFAVLLLAACARQPEKPLELRLTLAKTKIESGEYLWYRLEATNVGRKPLLLQGEFWHDQNVLENWTSRRPIRIEIFGPDGEEEPMRKRPWGYHGESKFWANDCGGGRPCEGFVTPLRKGPWPWSGTYLSRPFKELAPGETWAATPSMVAPIRPKNPDHLDDPGDARALPSIPKDWSPQKVAAMRKWWKEEVERSGYLVGDPGFKGDPKSRPIGFRVLDLYSFSRPGKYRMRIIYSPFGYAEKPVAREMTQNEISKEEESLALSGWPKETRVFWYETNWVEFEVVASSFPAHLFRRRAGDNAQERSKLDYLEGKLKERQIWAEDSPKEREAKLAKEQEASRQRKKRDAKIKKLMQGISLQESK